jgi:sporulation protein YlmC with PRC-barrel domain
MAKIQTRIQFKNYCLRRLGFPVVQINVDDDQIEDRIEDALDFFNDFHYDGLEKMYMKHKITEEDRKRRWIYAPDAVSFITGILPFDDSNSSINMFDLRYQLRLHDLYDFTSVSYVSYEITMQHIRSLQLLFSGTPQFRFNRLQNKLFIDEDWDRKLQVGDYIIVECYRKLVPDTVTLTGTVTGSTTSNTILGFGTKFDQEILENDFIQIGTELRQVRVIESPTEIRIVDTLTSNVNNVSVTVSGNSDVWDNRFLKKYATALIKRQWGENMKKFGGIQMPGGVTLNGKEIYDEAVEEIGKIEEDTFNLNSLPSEIFTG